MVEDKSLRAFRALNGKIYNNNNNNNNNNVFIKKHPIKLQI